MACDRTLLTQAYLDGELDPAAALELEAHVAGCADCQATIAAQGSLSAALRQVPRRRPAPVGLERRILAVLDGIDVKTPAPDGWPRRFGRFLAARRQFLAGAAAGMAFAGAVAVAVFLSLPGDGGEVADALAAANTRILIAQHPADIESADVDKLRPWFTRRVALAPPIADLGSAGYQLVGGRAEFIDGKRVAALIYARDNRYVSLFIWSAYDSAAPDGIVDRDGYHLLMWTAHGLVFCEVSDESLDTMHKLAKLIAAEADKSAGKG